MIPADPTLGMKGPFIHLTWMKAPFIASAEHGGAAPEKVVS